MRVNVITCGPYANESERRAVYYLERKLLSEKGDDEWVLLTNLVYSVNHRLRSDEIDIVAIGPPGVRVIEVKHWAGDRVKHRLHEVEDAVELIMSKARKVGTSLRRFAADFPYVDAAILLTEEASRVKQLAGRQIRGVNFHALSDWREAIGLDGSRVLSANDVNAVRLRLAPRSALSVDGSLRRLAGYVNLELDTPPEERFHRIFRGIHPTRRDRVILHLYDLSASDHKRAEARARREFEALRRLQQHAWAPRVLDSFQDAPGYPGEMFFFTILDPSAPTLEQRAEDQTWKPKARLEFARKAMEALGQLHSETAEGHPLIHRNLSPRSILVRHDNGPILSGFELTKIASDVSVISRGASIPSQDEYVAPELREAGLAAADARSDVYSLCASLAPLFQKKDDELSQRAAELLGEGLRDDPADRSDLAKLIDACGPLLGEPEPRPEAPPARYWTEGQMIDFNGRAYRVVSRLGSGGVGSAFKVVEIDEDTNDDLGAFVAKVIDDEEEEKRILRSYRDVRSLLDRSTRLSTIFEVAQDRRENHPTALLTWVEGSPLEDFAGLLPELAEDSRGRPSAEALVIRWLKGVCEALGVLHDGGFIHGDVSPRNLILTPEEDLVLIDHDFVTRIGQTPLGLGTAKYSPPPNDQPQAAPSDDIYQLAASLFRVFFNRDPFLHRGAVINKRLGLNWEENDRDDCPSLAEFLDKATDPNPANRFATTREALELLNKFTPSVEEAEEEPAPKEEVADAGEPVPSPTPPSKPPSEPLHKRRVEWVDSVLRAYPGARWGNSETRGLDSPFSESTYVETPLENALLREIRDRSTRLVILCGNAGDGKTALLQHLARKLGLGRHPSAKRVLEGRPEDGPRVQINLDGSAAWSGRSADEILDDFLKPFQNGPPDDDVAHLLAINDGRLLEWVEGFAHRNGGEATPLTEYLASRLDDDSNGLDDDRHRHVRFISLNRRSLVGNVERDNGRSEITTEFLDQLLDQLYGGDQAGQIWSPCLTCSANYDCGIHKTAKRFGPANLPFAGDETSRQNARGRLFEALQAAHLRGETHITMRELRAALVYILFGLDRCEDYHKRAPDLSPYWDRAFDAHSEARQGELLAELARFDPAWEAHPKLDRHLTSRPIDDETDQPPRYPDLALKSARRRAFFEWDETQIERIAGDAKALGLARGRHLSEFHRLPLMDQEELDKLRDRICRGVSRLKFPPPVVKDRAGVVPLRITPRTPTETIFWVEKPLERFQLEARLFQDEEGIDQLHRQAILTYLHRDGTEERLLLGAELFHLLLESDEGYQLGDASTDDVFANLSIFVQRLVQEDARELFAWNPMRDEAAFRVAIREETSPAPRQRLTLSLLEEGNAT